MVPWKLLKILTPGRSDSLGRAWRRSRSPTIRPSLEVLEGRLCPSGGYLLVDSFNTNSVLRYDETTGAFAGVFVPKNTGGLYSSASMDFGPDHDLYVSNGLYSPNNKANDVLRFNGTTGAFLGDFADSGQLTDPRGVVFGTDGNLYVADGNGPGRVLRYDGSTGAFIDVFVSSGSGGLNHPSAMLFGPDGSLYVMDTADSQILRFEGPGDKHPGAFIDTFVSPGSGGMHQPLSMAFGPDGNLYVANSFANDPTSGGVLRYDGKTGAFIDTFIAPGSGGLLKPLSVLFGPRGDLFVGSAAAFGASVANPNTSTVLRFDGVTGSFLGAFVAPDGGGLRYPSQLLFTETDPVTLAFHSGEDQSAEPTAADAVKTMVNSDHAQPGLADAVAGGAALPNGAAPDGATTELPPAFQGPDAAATRFLLADPGQTVSPAFASSFGDASPETLSTPDGLPHAEGQISPNPTSPVSFGLESGAQTAPAGPKLDAADQLFAGLGDDMDGAPWAF